MMPKHPFLAMLASKRAKQFAPFAAVKGLDEALARKRKIRVPRRELLEDQAEEINKALVSLKRGQIITVVYYNDPEEEYIQLTGLVAKVDEYRKQLQIVMTKIAFEDIFEICLEDGPRT